MVGTKSRGYSNSGRLSEGEYSMPFFSTRHSPMEQSQLIGPHIMDEYYLGRISHK